MELKLALGIVINLGGLMGQGEGDIDGDTMSSLGDSIGDAADGIADLDDFSPTPTWAQRVLTTIVLFVVSTTTLLAQKVGEAVEKTSKWYHNFALYVGPEVTIGPFFLTGGACVGGFGCFAIGGGFNIGKNFGIGILVPIWIWW